MGRYSQLAKTWPPLSIGNSTLACAAIARTIRQVAAGGETPLRLLPQLPVMLGQNEP